MDRTHFLISDEIMNKRELLARVLDSSRLGSLLSLSIARWTGLLVLNYHRVGDRTGSSFDRALWSATADQFDRQVRFLKRNFDVVRIADLASLLGDRRRRGVLITFDDGYRDNYEIAWPILKGHNASATFFITSGFLDRRHPAWWDAIAWMVHKSPLKELPPLADCLPRLGLETESARETAIQRILRFYKQLPVGETTPFLSRLGEAAQSGECPPAIADENWMTWEMVREMDSAGMDIGGHTVNHPVLGNCSEQRQLEEIVSSKLRIEQELGHAIRAFSYPVGQTDSFTATTKSLLREAGYEWAFSFYGGLTPTLSFDRFDLPREAISPEIGDPWFRTLVHLPQLFARPRRGTAGNSQKSGMHFPDQNPRNVDQIRTGPYREHGPVGGSGQQFAAAVSNEDRLSN